MPNELSTDDTLSIEVDTSVPLRSANFMNLPDRFSSSLPVLPNLVLTSPIAEPAVSKSVGISDARFFIESCISSSALPEAPVFCTIVSAPASTSLNAAIDAAPTAINGAVTFCVRLLPTLPIESPAFFSFSPAPLTLAFFMASFAALPKS